MIWIFEAIIISLFALYFTKKENPKPIFFFYGFLFAIVALIFRIPLLLALNYFKIDTSNLTLLIISGTLLTIISAIINEITRYLSLKKFLTTKSYKNAMLFALGWATFNVIIIFQNMILNFFIAQFSFLSTLTIEQESYGLLGFTLLFTTTLAQTVFIIYAIIKNKKRYITYSILYSIFLFILTDIPFQINILFFESTTKILAIIINLTIFFKYKIFK